MIVSNNYLMLIISQKPIKKDYFPITKMIADDYGGTRMNCVEWKERVGEVDKKHVALAAGGILALVGAISLIKYLVGKHE